MTTNPSLVDSKTVKMHDHEASFTLIRAGEVPIREAPGEQRRYYFGEMVDVVLVTSTNKHKDPPHLHTANTETYFIIRGELLMNVSDQKIRLVAGDLLVVPPGVCHSFETTSQEVVFLAVKKEPSLKDKELSAPILDE